jgi:hypothetical protein
MAKRRAGSQTASLTSDQKKSGIDPKYLAADNMRHTLESSQRELNFTSDCASIRGLLAKLRGFKVPGVPEGGISRLPHGSHGKNSHLDVDSAKWRIVYYKGEGGGFPQVRPVVSLVCPCCPWLVLTPSVLQLCTNHFVWVVCRPV